MFTVLSSQNSLGFINIFHWLMLRKDAVVILLSTIIVRFMGFFVGNSDQTAQQTVHSVFWETLVRAPNPDEVSYWKPRLIRRRRAVHVLTDALKGCVEYREVCDRLSPFRNLVELAEPTDEDWLNIVFQSLLCRDPDPEARQFYLHHLQTTGLPRKWVVLQVVQSDEFRALSDRRQRLLGKYLGRNPSPGNSYDRIEQMQLEITTLCNMNPPCAMCERSWSSSRSFNMKDDVTQHFRDLIAPDAEVCLLGQGEPLMNPHLWDLVDRLTSDNRKIGFSTNGLLMDHAQCKHIVTRQLGWINISVDAASVDTYHRIRGGDFQMLCDNIKTLSSLRTGKYPEIIINMLIMKTNKHEVSAFSHLAIKLGVDKVQYHVLNPAASPGRETMAPNGERFIYEDEMIQCREDDVVMSQLAEAEKFCREQSIGFCFIGDYTPVEAGP
jgi:molybdenum cofactor biosynthesis enzyme MoaA